MTPTEQPRLSAATVAAIIAVLAVTPAVSSPRRQVPRLLSHEDRQALIRKPFPIVYLPPVKRWGGVQIINDEDWMRDANAWRKRYAQDDNETEAIL